MRGERVAHGNIEVEYLVPSLRGCGSRNPPDAAAQLPVIGKVLPKRDAGTQNRLVASGPGLPGRRSNGQKEGNRSVFGLVQHQLGDYNVTKTGGRGQGVVL